MFNSRQYMLYNGGALRPKSDFDNPTIKAVLTTMEREGGMPAGTVIDFLYNQDALNTGELTPEDRFKLEAQQRSIRYMLARQPPGRKKIWRKQLKLARSIANGTLWKPVTPKKYRYAPDMAKAWREAPWQDGVSWNKFKRGKRVSMMAGKPKFRKGAVRFRDLAPEGVQAELASLAAAADAAAAALANTLPQTYVEIEPMDLDYTLKRRRDEGAS